MDGVVVVPNVTLHQAGCELCMDSVLSGTSRVSAANGLGSPLPCGLREITF